MGAAMTQEFDSRDRRTLTLGQLEEMRLKAIAEVKRLETLLGKAIVRGRRARRGGFVARNLERRERLKQELAHHVVRLATVNAAIKSGRRAGNLMLLHGVERPRTERELVSALYRLFTDVVPPAEQTVEQRTIMQLARDYVTSGVIGRG